MNPIYLDNNATTQLDRRVLEVMIEELATGPSNPSSIHGYGRRAQQRLQRARDEVAAFFAARPDEILFTSSGTEAINLAIRGMRPQKRIISTRIEHAAVYNTLEQLGLPITYLPVDLRGHIDLADLEGAMGPDVSMLVLSGVNSETGVKNPIDAIAQIAQEHSVPFIVDGVGWLGKELLSIPKGVSAMAFSSHKIHGPTGVGCLYLRKGSTIYPQLSGGNQERALRAGTENLPGIVGFAKAIALLKDALPGATSQMERLRDLLEAELQEVARPAGAGERICNTSSLTFAGMDGESLLIQLDQNGICASMGSACSSSALEPSRVLLEMGLSREEARSTLRFSLSRFTTEEEIRRLCALLSFSVR